MRNDEIDSHAIKNAGWRQGSVLPSSLVHELIDGNSCPVLAEFSESADNDWWLVVSQDCDVMQRDFDKEPFVEIIRVEPTEKHVGGDHWGKNPRRFQFVDKATGIKQLLQVNVHDRARIDRYRLADYPPDSMRCLELKNIQCICRWISQRYVRPAFPDAFNERADAAIPSLRKKLKQQGDYITSILIQVEDEELPAGRDYHPVIWATMTVDDYANAKLRAEALKMLNRIRNALSQCDGISVEDESDEPQVELKSEQDVSLDHLRQFKRWDFDDLTLRSQSVEQLIPSE